MSTIPSIILKAPFRIKSIRKAIISPIVTSIIIYLSVVALLLAIYKLIPKK